MVGRAVKDFKDRVDILDMDLEKQENADLAQKYQVNVIPTYVFLDSKGNVIDKSVGALTKDQLYPKLRAIEGR